MLGMSQSQIELLEGPALTPPPGVTSNFDNPYSLRPAADAVKIVTTILATLAIFIRVYTKWRIIREVHLEDYIAVAAWCGYVVFNVTTGFDPNVFGRHQWDIRLKDYQIFLYMSFKEHIGVSAVFSTGLLACIASMARLFVSLKLLKNPDASWYTSIMCIPSYVELGAGIITSCLPTLPKFFKTMSQIPRVSRMCNFVSSLSKSSGSSAESKESEERSSNSSWNQHRRMPSGSRGERRGEESYDVLEEWEGHNAAFSTVSLGNTTTATGMRNERNCLGMRNERNCLEMKHVDEERGILRSVQISIVRQGPLSGEGRNAPMV
ncbi:hypothetical protein BPAE_0120g00170 [Botrytis paeoniae]|uniref:Rhodopsin domain-containing protein n=1 Tax=Botrytis paeoniae TaxID=278948 RepID=A0A4Z1FKD3_9HELO|nr:hypothetical protein BPAE_0120g00170 [Botrytis paeoniae]